MYANLVVPLIGGSAMPTLLILAAIPLIPAYGLPFYFWLTEPR